MTHNLDPGRDPMDGLIVFATPSASSNNGDMQDNEIEMLWPPPENGIIPSPPDHVIEECPGLVSSDEDDGEFVPASNSDECVKRWVAFGKGPHIEEEVEKIKNQYVGLYLLGMGTCAPPVWISTLVQGGVFPYKEKIYILEELDDKEMLMAEIAEEIFKRNKQIFWPKGKQVMKDIMETVDDIEKNGLSAEVIEVRRALQIAMNCDFFREEWNKLKELELVQKFLKECNRNDSQPVLCSLLFFYKLVHHHVFYYGHHKGTMADKIVKDLFTQGQYAFNITVAKDEGNKYFRDKNYREAIKMYSVAMIKDYANPFVYGNRAQCYIYLKEYRRAYCDCRRAMFLNPTWPKAYYRCALASIHLGKLDEAMRRNEEARCACRDSKDLHKDISRLKDMYVDIIKQRLNIIKELENKKIATDLDLQLMKADSKVAVELSSKKAAGIPGDMAEDAKKIDFLLDSVQMRYKNKPRARNDSESARSAQGHPPRPQEQTDTDKFILNLKEALEAVNLNNFVRATGKYEAALTLWNHSDKVKSLCGTDQIIVVRYAYGITALSQEGVRTVLLDSLQMFRTMFRDNFHNNFPLVLYGLGRAYVALYRFSEALKVVDVQLSKAKKKAWKEVCWPGSKQTIEESKLAVFMREMVKLKELCQIPPQADAVCFEHMEQDEAREIYKQSPTYTGIVTMSCYAKCSFVFHISCWKEYKGKVSADKISEKEMVDRQCPTPDCGSFIYCILIERPDKTPHKFQSQEEVVIPRGNHKIGRMKLSNPDKITKKQERKEIKRQKRLKALQKGSCPGSPTPSESNIQQTITDLIELPDSSLEKGEVPLVALTENAMVVLHKEGKQDNKYNSFQKQVRQKKKKDKENKKGSILSLDFNFTDDMEREANRVGELEALDEEIASSGNKQKPPRLAVAVQQSSITIPQDNVFAVPLHLREQCESFSNIVAKKPSRNPTQVQREEEIKSTFNGYMFDFLREAGPQFLHSQRMRQELEDIPEEVNRVIKQCGGIRKYFEMNDEFFVSGECVGIETDAEKVCKMADGGLPSKTPLLSIPSAASTNPSLVSRPLISSTPISRPLIGSTNFYNSNNPGTVTTNCDIDEADDSVHRMNSRTLSNYPNRTDSPDLENSRKKAAKHDMTLPSLSSSIQGLNPSAPEFQPGFLGQPRSMQDHEQGFCQDQQVADACGDSDDESSHQEASVFCPSNSMLDTFTTTGIDDIDDYDFSEMDKIDEADFNHAPTGNECMDLDDITIEHSTVAPEATSRRSSKSDLSQTSDFSTGGLFRGASPSSSVSSHKGTSNRDIASPFSVRDTSSPGFPSSRAAEAFRRTDSPVVSSSLYSASTLDTNSSELGLSAGFATSIALSSQNSDHLSYNSLGGGESSVPKPLKPLAPIGSIGSALGDSGSSVILPDISLRGGNIPTSTTLDSFSLPSSLLTQHQSPMTSNIGFTGVFPSLSSSSSTWGSLSSSLSTWPTNTFPTAVRPEEDVVNSIPPFPTSHLFSQPSSSSSVYLPATPAPIPFPSSSSSAWSTGNLEDWPGSRVKVVEKVEQGIQAGVDVRSVEVNTEMTGCQLDMQQQHLLQQLQQLHALYTQSQQELKNVEEERIAVKRERDDLRTDLNKAVLQLGNLETDCASMKENYIDSESRLRGLQEQNKMSAMETNNLMQKVSQLEDLFNKERQRAKHAEVQMIQEQIENFKIHLDKKIKESEMFKIQASNNIQSFQDVNPSQLVPKYLEDRLVYAEKVVECWTDKKVDIMRQLVERQEQIVAGRLQSELAPLCIFPNLPTPPDGMGVSNNNGSSSQPSKVETRQPTPTQFPSSTEEFVSSASTSSIASGAGQQRPKGPPGLSAPRVPTPLRPPLGLSGVTLPSRPAGTQAQSFAELSKTQSAPPPLRPINTSKVGSGAPLTRAHTPPLATQTAYKPVGVAATVPLRPVGSGVPQSQPQQSSYSKMVAVLQKSFPNCDKEEFARAIRELRQAHNGKLSGLDLEFIVRHVTNMLIARGFKPQPQSHANQSSSSTSSSKASETKRTAPPPGLSAAWSVEGLEPLAGDRFLEEEDPCAICHEEMSAAPVQTLECAHRFHDECIRTWFKQQTTCPKCRTYAPLLDDFPTLK